MCAAISWRCRFTASIKCMPCMQQRKSRRLHAKAATKEAESRGRREREQVAIPAAGPAEVEQVPVAVETVPDVDGTVDDSVTSSGQLAEYLLQTVKDQEVAMLTSQVLRSTQRLPCRQAWLTSTTPFTC